jgi:D-alanyl-lipoteichoic acid acyltransferase DltB (MBOAT superfamily)
VYIPLGGSRPDTSRLSPLASRLSPSAYTKCIAVRNTFIIFLLSGFWHGANWTFVLWGAYHALLFVPLLLMNKNRRYRDTVATIILPDGTIKAQWLPSLKEAGQMLLTFALAVFGWIIFRVQEVGDVWIYVTNICQSSLFTMPMVIVGVKKTCLAIGILLVVEWFNRAKSHALDIATLHPILRYVGYYALILIMLEYGANAQSFIYFQF